MIRLKNKRGKKGEYMKKKILMFLLSLCFILPCAVLLTACGEDNSTHPTSPSNNQTSFTVKESTYGINFTTVDCTYFSQDEPCDELFDFVNSGDVAVWAVDYLDKDTLKICLNEDELVLTPLTVDDDYATRNLSTRFRKIATFTWDTGRMKSPGENELIVTADEIEMDINFVSNGQTFNDEEKAILDDWCITDVGGQSLLSLMDSNQSLKITYRKLVNYYLEESVVEDDGHIYFDSGIRYTCKKPMGYYVEAEFFKVVDPQLYISRIEQPKADHKNFSVTIHSMGEVHDDLSLPTNIDVTFNKDKLCLAGLTLGGTCKYNNCEILTMYNGNDPMLMHDSWYATNENDIKVYLEPYSSVDLSNVEVYIYNTKMTLQTDTSNNKKYFVIAKNKLPVDFYTNTETYHLANNSYEVELKNVVISEDCDLYTTLQLNIESDKAKGYIVAPVYYAEKLIDEETGIHDYKLYYKPTVDKSHVYFYNFKTNPSKITINGKEINLSNYVRLRNDIPNAQDMSQEEKDALSSYYYPADETSFWYRYKFTQDGIDFKIELLINSNGSINSLTINFAITGNTTISLSFPS